MNQLLDQRRERHRRKQKQRPLGLLTAMFTACVVTLIGVFSDVEPFAVLLRASISAVLIGSLVGLGMGVVRTANIRSDQT